MSVLAEKAMPDGRKLRILRVVSPEDSVPENVVRYVIASIGFDSYNKYIPSQGYWRSFYREAFEGKLTNVRNYVYIAEVDGTFAARLWFAYSVRNGFGNFGNVYTETAFRRLGLMSELLKPCMADFEAAQDARILCCASGNAYAVRSYLKCGFRLTYGGETGALERTRRPGEDFFSIEKEVFADTRLASIRPGEPDDQFITDKFIAHTRENWQQPMGARRGPASYIPDFRIARIEAEIGSGALNVALNAAGTVTGHCYALQNNGGTGTLDFTAHAKSYPDLPELIKATAAEFHQKFTEDLFFYAFAEDKEKITAVQTAGGKRIGQAGQTEIFVL